MNSSKGNFLDRFNGKIGFITKHGDLISRSSFDETPNSKLTAENDYSISTQKLSKAYKPFVKDSHEK